MSHADQQNRSAYKYTQLGYLSSILANRYLWFSNIDSLNDPFECDIRSFKYDWFTFEKEKSYYMLQMSEPTIMRRGGLTPNHYYDHPVGELGGPPEWVVDDISRREGLYLEYRDFRKAAYVLSLSTTNLSPAMWAHYGDGFAGVCLKVDQELMESALNRTGLNWKRLLVQYSESKPELPGDVPGAVEHLLAHKHPDWSYEREVRYVVWIDQESGQEEAGIKVTVDDAVEADELFTILMGEKVEPRREFIENHAKDVINLDI